MSTAKEAILNGLSGISDDIQDEYEVLEGLYKNIKLEQSRKSIQTEGTMTTEEVRNYFSKKHTQLGIRI